MEGFGININGPRGASRYRADEVETWELDEAAERAFALLHSRQAAYVTVGDGNHELRIWGDVDHSSYGNLSHNGRWAEWYVDVEINGRRWQYQPLADLDDWDAADSVAEEACELHPHVKKLWVGRSDGSEESESDVDPG